MEAPRMSISLVKRLLWQEVEPIIMKMDIPQRYSLWIQDVVKERIFSINDWFEADTIVLELTGMSLEEWVNTY